MKRDKPKHNRKKTLLQLASVALAVLFVAGVAVFNRLLPFRTLLPAASLGEAEEGALCMYFLDVGQGDCSVIRFPEGGVLVIDAGDGAWEHENTLIRFFKELNATSYTFVATHADADHCGGIAELIRTFGADTLYLPALSSESAVYLDMLAAAEEQSVPVETAKRYEVIAEGGAYAVFLSPYSAGETDENDSSAVLYLRYAGVTALFTADITSEREALLMREYAIDETLFDSGSYAVRLNGIDFLKVAHHGSAYSSSAEWLSLLSPAVSVISCGRGNAYGHPAAAALARLKECGSEIYRTDELGSLLFTVTAAGELRFSTVSL